MNKIGKEQIRIPINSLKTGERYTFYTKYEVPTDEELEEYNSILSYMQVKSPKTKLHSSPKEKKTSSPKEKKTSIIRGNLSVFNKENGLMKINNYTIYNHKTGEWEEGHGIYQTRVNDVSKITQYAVGPNSGPTNDIANLINSFLGGRKTIKKRKTRKVKKTRHTKKSR